jgi:two-component system chemotaxis response regulator CheB
LLELVNDLPADLGAAVLVCQHTSQQSRSQLPVILARRARLPAAWAVDSERLETGRIYVAPPGHHLLVHDGRARVSSGPRVNRHRPSLDVLFASAAQCAGRASTVVVLSGVLDDGAVGAALVDLVGGSVWVQDPTSAEFSGMPSAALAAAPSARIMMSTPISRDVAEAVARGGRPRSADVRPATVGEEVGMPLESHDDPGFLKPGESRLTRLACPDCGGGLAQVDLPQISYFRCHVGHQYGPRTLAAAQAEASEQKLWSAVAALEEQAVLQRYLEGTDVPESVDPDHRGTYRRSAQELADRAAALREQVQRWASVVDPGSSSEPL